MSKHTEKFLYKWRPKPRQAKRQVPESIILAYGYFPGPSVDHAVTNPLEAEFAINDPEMFPQQAPTNGLYHAIHRQQKVENGILEGKVYPKKSEGYRGGWPLVLVKRAIDYKPDYRDVYSVEEQARRSQTALNMVFVRGLSENSRVAGLAAKLGQKDVESGQGWRGLEDVFKKRSVTVSLQWQSLEEVREKMILAEGKTVIHYGDVFMEPLFAGNGEVLKKIAFNLTGHTIEDMRVLISSSHLGSWRFNMEDITGDNTWRGIILTYGDFRNAFREYLEFTRYYGRHREEMRRSVAEVVTGNGDWLMGLEYTPATVGEQFAPIGVNLLERMDGDLVERVTEERCPQGIQWPEGELRFTWWGKRDVNKNAMIMRLRKVFGADRRNGHSNGSNKDFADITNNGYYHFHSAKFRN